jgi:tetratricopeptide (TPR) repeat protein
MAEKAKRSHTVDDAIALFERALARDTHWGEAQQARAAAALEAARAAKAAQDAARAAADAAYTEGSALFRAERWDEAIAAVDRGLREPVNDEDLLRKLRRITKDAEAGKQRAADIAAVTAQVPPRVSLGASCQTSSKRTAHPLASAGGRTPAGPAPHRSAARRRSSSRGRRGRARRGPPRSRAASMAPTAARRRCARW